jgi:hypothetical protein
VHPGGGSGTLSRVLARARPLFCRVPSTVNPFSKLTTAELVPCPTTAVTRRRRSRRSLVRSRFASLEVAALLRRLVSTHVLTPRINLSLHFISFARTQPVCSTKASPCSGTTTAPPTSSSWRSLR